MTDFSLKIVRNPTAAEPVADGQGKFAMLSFLFDDGGKPGEGEKRRRKSGKKLFSFCAFPSQNLIDYRRRQIFRRFIAAPPRPTPPPTTTMAATRWPNGQRTTGGKIPVIKSHQVGLFSKKIFIEKIASSLFTLFHLSWREAKICFKRVYKNSFFASLFLPSETPRRAEELKREGESVRVVREEVNLS
jgi:hypothetical protein